MDERNAYTRDVEVAQHSVVKIHPATPTSLHASLPHILLTHLSLILTLSTCRSTFLALPPSSLPSFSPCSISLPYCLLAFLTIPTSFLPFSLSACLLTYLSVVLSIFLQTDLPACKPYSFPACLPPDGVLSQVLPVRTNILKHLNFITYFGRSG